LNLRPSQAGADIVEKHRLPSVILHPLPMSCLAHMYGAPWATGSMDVQYEGPSATSVLFPEAMTTWQKWVTNPLYKWAGKQGLVA
jgi:hypothetical protein